MADHAPGRRGGLVLALLILLGSVGSLAAAEGKPVPPGTGPVTSLPIPRFVSMRADSANARRGPSLDQRVDWEFVRRGMPLRITSEYGNWRRVEDVDGNGGWVHHTMLSGVRTALVIGSETVPLREEADETARVTAMLEPGVVARIKACEPGWCELAINGIEGWLPKRDIWGVGPDETFD